MSTPVTCQCAPLWSQGTPMGHMSTPPVYSENSADFNFPLYGEKIEMYLAVDLGCRAEERPASNNYDNNGPTHLLDSNRQHRCYVPRTNHHHINTARRRR
jgi:hypothetical protein